MLDQYTVEDFKVIFAKAQAAATARSEQEYNKYGTDQIGACGFAWVNILNADGKRIKGNTKLGKKLKAAGIDRDYNGIYSQWCNWYGGQNIDIKEAGAREFARVLEGYGFKAYAGSRLD
jgi:hypothetical protein